MTKLKRLRGLYRYYLCMLLDIHTLGPTIKGQVAIGSCKHERRLVDVPVRFCLFCGELIDLDLEGGIPAK